jgi:hypothetical protein
MINTEGFQVRNMPRYTAPNPSLVAFTPQPIAAGMFDTFKLAQQYENLKASKALQAEQAATRARRIEAENAKYLASIQLLPPETQAKLSALSADQPNIPLRGQLTGEKLRYDLGDIGAALKRQPTENEAKGVLSAIALETAKNEQVLLPELLNTRSSEVGSKLIDARLKEYAADQAGMDEAAVRIGTAQDAAANLAGDLMLRRQTAEAKLKTEEAQAQHLRTQGQNIIPAGVTYDRAVENVAGKLNMTVPQVKALAGTRIGLNILSKIGAAQTSITGTARLTPQEEAVLASIMNPSPDGSVPAPKPAPKSPPSESQRKQTAPSGNKIKFRTDASGNIVPVTK